MNKPQKYFLNIVLLVSLTTIIFVLLNKENNKENNKEIIRSSHQSGLYLKPFKLSLTTKKENLIRYTFDSSIPTKKSNIFTKNLLITSLENNDSLSYINTTIDTSIANFGWRPPLGKQDKATVLKYAAFKGENCISDIKTLTFFIDTNLYYYSFPNTTKNKILNTIKSERLNKIFPKDSILNTKYNLPIISISTNKDSLFSNEKGLFVSGNSFNTNKIHSGNYFERGKKFEREVFFQYFTKEGNLSFELNIGMRIHGGITRRNPQKSLKFYAREEYGTEKIFFPFIGNKGINRFILESMQESGGGQALIEDIVAQEIVKDLKLESQKFQAVIVFINGEYWGIHNIRERLDENYLSYKFNLHKDSFDIIDGNPTLGYEPIHGSNSDYIKMIDFVKENELSNDSNYNLLSKGLDIDNLIDYYSVEIFFANHDWPIHNIKMYRKKGGKWRFLLYDLDGGFTNKRDHTFNMFERISKKEGYINPESTFLFRNLMTNQNFRNKFEYRYKEIIDLYMQPETTIPIVDSIASIYRINMQSHINRWRYPWSVKHHWEKDIEKNIKEFLKNREESTLNNLNAIIGNN